MLTRYALFVLSSFAIVPSFAERIYIMPGMGYNQCDPLLVTAIQSQGHTVVVAPNNATTLPVGFTTTCVDPVNGYDWLCFFGNESRIALLPDVQAFIDLGGKLFLQWEVSCCTISSLSSATIAAALTGQPIVEDLASSIAGGTSPNVPGWEAQTIEGCLNVAGNAYKCMNGVPPANQLLATATLNGASPAHIACPVFGFVFGPTDLPNGSGGIVGFGDVNMWYTSAGEPPNNGGVQPVDMDIVSLLFPTPTSGCSLLPPGCLSGTTAVSEPARMIGSIHPNPASQQLVVELAELGLERIEILDAVGRIVRNEPFVARTRIEMDISALAPGLYHAVVLSIDRSERATFMVAR